MTSPVRSVRGGLLAVPMCIVPQSWRHLFGDQFVSLQYRAGWVDVVLPLVATQEGDIVCISKRQEHKCWLQLVGVGLIQGAAQHIVNGDDEKEWNKGVTL